MKKQILSALQSYPKNNSSNNTLQRGAKKTYLGKYLQATNPLIIPSEAYSKRKVVNSGLQAHRKANSTKKIGKVVQQGKPDVSPQKRIKGKQKSSKKRKKSPLGGLARHYLKKSFSEKSEVEAPQQGAGNSRKAKENLKSCEISKQGSMCLKMGNKAFSSFVYVQSKASLLMGNNHHRRKILSQDTTNGSILKHGDKRVTPKSGKLGNRLPGSQDRKNKIQGELRIGVNTNSKERTVPNPTQTEVLLSTSGSKGVRNGYNTISTLNNVNLIKEYCVESGCSSPPLSYLKKLSNTKTGLNPPKDENNQNTPVAPPLVHTANKLASEYSHKADRRPPGSTSLQKNRKFLKKTYEVLDKVQKVTKDNSVSTQNKELLNSYSLHLNSSLRRKNLSRKRYSSKKKNNRANKVLSLLNSSLVQQAGLGQEQKPTTKKRSHKVPHNAPRRPLQRREDQENSSQHFSNEKPFQNRQRQQHAVKGSMQSKPHASSQNDRSKVKAALRCSYISQKSSLSNNNYRKKRLLKYLRNISAKKRRGKSKASDAGRSKDSLLHHNHTNASQSKMSFETCYTGKQSILARVPALRQGNEQRPSQVVQETAEASLDVKNNLSIVGNSSSSLTQIFKNFAEGMAPPNPNQRRGARKPKRGGSKAGGSGGIYKSGARRHKKRAEIPGPKEKLLKDKSLARKYRKLRKENRALKRSLQKAILLLARSNMSHKVVIKIIRFPSC